jgi:hypothetical protein
MKTLVDVHKDGISRMKFSEVVDNAIEFLRQRERVSYWALKREFELDDEALDRHHIETMIARVTGGKPLPAEVVQQIVAKTDGVPLFVEELTKTVVESGLVREEDGRYVGAHGSAPIPPLAIPATLPEALSLIHKTEERNCEAELYRLKGELLLAQEGCRPQAVG